MATTKTPAAPVTADRTFTLVQEKVTKGAVRYKDEDGHTLYFRKEELTVEGHSGQFPRELKVSVNYVW